MITTLGTLFSPTELMKIKQVMLYCDKNNNKNLSIDVRRFHVFTGCVCVFITNSNMTSFIIYCCERQFFGLALNIVH